MSHRPSVPTVTTAWCCAGALIGLTMVGPSAAAADRTAVTIDVSTAAELTSALDAAGPGDTIRLADGSYRGYFTTSRAGTESAPVTLTGSERAVLATNGGGYGLHLDGASWWTVRGITVTGGQKGIVADAARGVVIDSVTLHDLDMEAVHFRDSSSDGVVRNSTIHDTGKNGRGMGEGVYIGTANTLSDKSDRVRVEDNVIGPGVGGEAVDAKEGTTGGRVTGNTFDGQGLTGANYDDSWVDVKGNDYLVENNTGKNTTNNGFEVHSQQPDWGCGTVFRGNRSDLTGATGSDRYAIHVADYRADCPTTVTSSNTVIGGAGLVTPGVPVTD